MQKPIYFYQTKLPLKEGALWGLDNRGDGYLDLDLHPLDPGNLWQYANSPSRCEKFTLT